MNAKKILHLDELSGIDIQTHTHTHTLTHTSKQALPQVTEWTLDHMHHALMLQLCLRHQIALLSPHHHNSQAEPYRLPLLQANFRSFSRSSAILVVVAVVTLLFSHSVMSDLCGHGLQHDGLPFPSPSPRTSSNSCSLSG